MAQLTSYPCLVFPYFLAGRNTIDHDVRIVRGFADISVRPRGKIYLINPADGHVWSIRLDGSRRRHEFAADLKSRWDVLAALREPDDEGQPWQLQADGRN